MELDTFIKDVAGFDPAAVTDAQRSFLTAQWKQAHAPKDEPPGDLEVKKEKANREHRRRTEITATVEREMDPRANPHLTAADRDLIATIGRKAIDDEWPLEKFELEMLRAKRPSGHFALTPQAAPEVSDAVIEAAVAKGAGLNNLTAFYNERTLEAADRAYPRGMPLSSLIMHYARRGGYGGHSVRDNIEAAVKAARRATDIQAAGSWGPSTQGASIGSLLGNVANKFLRMGFDAVETSWRDISAIRSANDFKQITSYSLTGDLTFKKLPPGGEIQHGQIDATSYTNQIDSYARMLGLDRRDIINDDLGAFGSVARRLGRGAAIALNKLFWGIFLNNSAVFTSGRLNLITGAGTTLQLSQLDVLNQKFLTQTDPDGNPLGVRAAILLVPPALEVTARQLMSSTALVSGATTTGGVPAQNIWAGRFRVVTSAYMQDSTLTGNSSTAWYLIADPQDLPLIEVAFLNGQQTPTVEESESDFGMLGRAWRGYFDIGVAYQEYRAGAKSAGA